MACVFIKGGPKTGLFFRSLYPVTPAYDEIGRRFIHQNVQLFIRSKTSMLNLAIVKHFVHQFIETIRH